MSAINYNAIHELAYERAVNDDDPLDFYAAALHIGCTDEEADRADTYLTEQAMRARGGI